MAEPQTDQATARADELERLTADQFRDVIGRFASGVTVITAVRGDVQLGTTASAFTSLSLDPPMVLACMNKESDTGRAVHESRRFGVSILGEGHPDLALRFARKGENKFEGIRTEIGSMGLPLLGDALATLECEVIEQTTGGTHLVFLARVASAAARPGNPLAYFRGKFGRFAPAEDEAAYRHLREAIIARRFPLDQPLHLDDVAAVAGIDRNTAYHALAQLANDRLVERSADGSFHPVPVTQQVMEDALIGRSVIEMGVASKRSGTLTEEEVARCRELLDRLEEAEHRTAAEWVEALNRYLDAYVALAGSPSLTDAFQRLAVSGLISTTRWASMATDPPPGSTDVHRQVLQAIVDGDHEAAHDAIEQRITGTIRGLRAAIDRAGGEL